MLKGSKHTEETIEKMKKSNRKFWFGKKRPDETRRKISQKLRGKKPNYKINGMMGKKHSEEARKKISEAGQGRKWTEKQRLQASKTLYVNFIG